ncbi:MAG: hypothetical protein ACK5AZ_20010 [Bryobacteraceae bacterium]
MTKRLMIVLALALMTVPVIANNTVPLPNCVPCEDDPVRVSLR